MQAPRHQSKRISLSNNITVVPNEMLSSCYSLKSISIPSGVISIGDNALSGCYALTKVSLPEKAVSIGNYAFSFCNALTEISLSKNTSHIGAYAFLECTALESFTIPEQLTRIEIGVFRSCVNLTSIDIPSNIVSIGSGAFESCTGIEKVYIADLTNWLNISFDNAYANPLSNGAVLYINGELVTELLIPNTVSEIKPFAFYGYTSLNKLQFEPNSICEKIGIYAFYECTQLTSITIPEPLLILDCNAFAECTMITEINFNATNINDMPDYDKPLYNVGLHSTGIKLTVAKNVTKIPSNLFLNYSSSNTTNLISVEFESGSVCESIGENAFYNCKALTKIKIPNSVKSIGAYAFYGCSSLLSATFENTADWWYASSIDDTSGNEISETYLKNFRTAASYLKSKYSSYYWKRG